MLSGSALGFAMDALTGQQLQAQHLCDSAISFLSFFAFLRRLPVPGYRYRCRMLTLIMRCRGCRGAKDIANLLEELLRKDRRPHLGR